MDEFAVVIKLFQKWHTFSFFTTTVKLPMTANMRSVFLYCQMLPLETNGSQRNQWLNYEWYQLQNSERT